MILVAGEALVDLFPDGSMRAGGSPFNVAIGLARLGARVALATRISGDDGGALLRATMAREGVDLRFLSPSSSPTPTARVALAADGTPSYSFTGLADLDLPVPARTGDVSCFHTGSYALVAPRSSAALLDRFADLPPNVLRSLDPNVRLSMEPSLERWRTAVAGFAARADILKVSEEDIRALAGGNADVDSIASGWLSDRCALVALTRGERGATLFSRRHGRIDGAARSVDVVDTVGAGDSFQAALLAGLSDDGIRSSAALDGMSPERLHALLLAAIGASASTCTRQGADPPTRPRLAS